MILKSKELERIKGYFIDPKTVLIITAGGDNDREEDFTLMIKIGNKQEINSYISNSEISCGVHQFTTLNYNAIYASPLNLVKLKYRKLFLIELYKEVFKLVKRKEKINTLIASTNNNPGKETIISVLDKISTLKTKWKINPNSGNKIRMWVL